MSKKVKNSVWAGLITLGFAVAAAGCGKYDKMDILGEWRIDLKEAKGLKVELAEEVLFFGSDDRFTQQQEIREAKGGNLDRWVIKGDFERKNNKIHFTDRVEDNTKEKKPPVTYKYRIDGEKLILIVKDEGFKNDEKVYTKKKKSEQ